MFFNKKTAKKKIILRYVCLSSAADYIPRDMPTYTCVTEIYDRDGYLLTTKENEVFCQEVSAKAIEVDILIEGQ